MKKNLFLVYFVISSLLLGLYIGNVEPAVDKPLVLAGFSILMFITIFWAAFIVLRLVGLGVSAYLISFITALAIVYLIALSSLNSLGLIDVGIVIISAALLIAYVAGPLRKRRKL